MKLLAKLSALLIAAASVSAYAIPIATTGDGFSVIVSGTGPVIAKYEGTTAAYTDNLFLGDLLIFSNQSTPVGTTVDLGTFAIGTELQFRIEVLNTGDTFYTGAASRNGDGNAHARVQSDFFAVGTTLVSFEDLYGGPFEFNDLSFSFTNTAAADLNGVPEPGSLALLGLGLAAVAVSRKRKQA